MGYGAIRLNSVKNNENRWPGKKRARLDSGYTRNSNRGIHDGGYMMLRWALTFFVVALIAAVLGFTGVALAAAGIAKILFYLFLILFLVTLVGHLLRRT
jgi:uncharacterized membrane protein YtjA (UPF0391 family)